MENQQRPERVKDLHKTLAAAIHAGQTDEVRSVMTKLGPHAKRFTTTVYNSDEGGKGKMMGLGMRGHVIEMSTIHPTATALELATILGVKYTEIGKAVDQKLMELDEESRFEEMAAAVHLLLKTPEWGIREKVVVTYPGGQGGSEATSVVGLEPVRTWRLQEVEPTERRSADRGLDGGEPRRSDRRDARARGGDAAEPRAVRAAEAPADQAGSPRLRLDRLRTVTETTLPRSRARAQESRAWASRHLAKLY